MEILGWTLIRTEELEALRLKEAAKNEMLDRIFKDPRKVAVVKGLRANELVVKLAK